MATTTIRVDTNTHARLIELSESSGATLMDTVSAAAEALRRQRFAGVVVGELDRLRADPGRLPGRSGRDVGHRWPRLTNSGSSTSVTHTRRAGKPPAGTRVGATADVRSVIPVRHRRTADDRPTRPVLARRDRAQAAVGPGKHEIRPVRAHRVGECESSDSPARNGRSGALSGGGRRGSVVARILN